ncbi:vacuolar fusion protein [Botryosphaeria dothidea]|uniref:Vacuolar fusion protein n=1 Tax=Botryosphaeria dothidea TaxID=55169 RepID=A0A8H4J7W7_9PEZI|nr:vacuolar fusion protein [Botryosphaeria dothidea]
MAARVVPAQLAFLAIFCPYLADNDDAFREQLVFYYSNKATRRNEDDKHDDENERLRQIGLAQGMIDFARSFSDGEPVDHVDTEKSRIVMHEFEQGWWVLASIDLTRLPAGPSASNEQPAVEYSVREVAPPELLLRQLLRAHSIFRLHHGPSLADLYVRLPRQKFCNILDRFWSRFAKDWDVLLHGNPATDIYPAMKLAAGGELGMGVGEEEWGSGEREVFEDFTSRTEGMLDMVVSRFGEPRSNKQKESHTEMAAEDEEPWMGTGRSPESTDGVIFSGVGALSRSSLRDISNWMRWLYTFGDHAYGVKENPGSDRRRRRRRERMSRQNNRLDGHRRTASQKSPRAVPLRNSSSLPPRIPRPIVTAVEQSLDQASSAADAAQDRERTGDEQQGRSDGDTWMKYLTWGYSSSWGGKRPSLEQRSSELSEQSTQTRAEDDQEKNRQLSMQHADPRPDVDPAEEASKAQVRRENNGHFLIGLQGDLEEIIMNNDDDTERHEDGDTGTNWEGRTLLRTLHVKVNNQSDDEESSEATVSQPQYRYERVRVIIYVHRPFITTMLFEARTATLSYPSFYRHLHSYLAPLHKPLAASTSPSRIAARIAAASNPYTTTSGGTGPNQQPIYDLIYDPLNLTVHSGIPNIPEPGTAGAEGFTISNGSANGPSWTRVEALNVHSQVLTTLGSARRAPNDIERTAKTSRGWWLVWMRLPPSRPMADNLVSPESPALPAILGRTPSAKASASSLKSSTPSMSGTTELSSANEEESTLEESSTGPAPTGSQSLPTATLREAILIRRSREAAGPASGRGSRHGASASVGSAAASSLWRLGLGGGNSAAATGGAAAGWGPRGLAEGVGIDARRYVEGLLSLNR